MVFWQIEEKKKRRTEQLEDKHRMETAQKLSSQQQQRDQLNEKIAKDVENDALKKNVKVGHLSAIYLGSKYFEVFHSSFSHVHFCDIKNPTQSIKFLANL